MKRRSHSKLLTDLLAVISIAAAAALLFHFSRFGDLLERLSFDTLFLFRPEAAVSEVVIVKIGEDSYKQLQQEYPRFSRVLHARLLEKLTRDGAKLVVYDVFFSGERPGEDAEMANAIKAHGNVVLGFSTDPVRARQIVGTAINKSVFEGLPGSQSGSLEVLGDLDLAVRRFPPERTNVLSLSSAAAKAWGKSLPPPERRWIAYYPSDAFTEIEFHAALDEADGFFRDKVVFIGGRPKTLFPGEDPDNFAVATTRWTGEALSGVDIQANLFLNLIRDEWLRVIAPGAELALILTAAVLIGLLLAPLRPIPGFIAASAFAVAVFAAAFLLCWGGRSWFNWLLLSGIQAPAAWLASALLYARRLEQSERVPPAQAPASLDSAATSAETLADPPRETTLLIRDYKLLSCVGRGGYGEVWLAQSVTGALKALKLVFRGRFADERPYLREFQGVKNFEPISRLHPGWVSILHVAKDDTAGYFYYVMDPADDLLLGSHIDPARYQPQTLENLLVKRTVLPVSECLSLGIAIADALGALHTRGLIHRDVKPSNIVYIGGSPRLADIGLVAQIGKNSSYVGTEGYLPPEGPGAPLADIFSLGRVLYQAATGLKCKQPPEPQPSQNPADRDLSLYLQAVQKACASFHGKRFQTAYELRDALVSVQAQLHPATRT